MADDRTESTDETVFALMARFFRKRRAAPNLIGSLSVAEVAEESRKRREEILRAAHLDILKDYDIMVPRADIVAVDLATPLAEVVALFAEAAVSRMPIYRDSLDDPVGMVHVKDLVNEIAQGGGITDNARGQERVLPRLRRDILFVPPSMRLSSLLLKMQTSRIHMALVIDEYGGTDGLLSIEDLVEQIVGDIEDEHDDQVDTHSLVNSAPGVWEVDARVPIPDVEAAIELGLNNEEWGDDIDTMGGLVFALLGRVPIRGEIVHHPAGLDVEVLDADPRRLKRLRLRRMSLEQSQSQKASAPGGTTSTGAGTGTGTGTGTGNSA